jgi:hypothetical protein
MDYEYAEECLKEAGEKRKRIFSWYVNGIDGGF